MPNYQLVLQWSASLIDFDTMVEIEDALIDGLAQESEVDGHDAGLGQVNIFIRTNSPHGTFEEIKPILDRKGALQGVRAAYRNLEASKYVIIWPKSLTEFTIS